MAQHRGAVGGRNAGGGNHRGSVSGAHSDVWLDKIRNTKDRLEVDYSALRAVSGIIEAAESDTLTSEPPAAGEAATTS